MSDYDKRREYNKKKMKADQLRALTILAGGVSPVCWKCRYSDDRALCIVGVDGYDREKGFTGRQIVVDIIAGRCDTQHLQILCLNCKATRGDHD